MSDDTLTIFSVRISPEALLEVRVSRASIPAVGIPPRPKRFEYLLDLGHGEKFAIQGELVGVAAGPAVGPPPKPK